MNKIPNKINILGKEFDIIYEDFSDHAGTEYNGALEVCTQKMWINTHRTHIQQQEESLIHEITEAINIMCDINLKHQDIQTISAVLYQVLSDNKLRFGD